MKGTDLRAARQRLGMDPREIAERAGVPPGDAELWEMAGVPKTQRLAVDLTLWELQRDAARAYSSCSERPSGSSPDAPPAPRSGTRSGPGWDDGRSDPSAVLDAP